jgi:hypothetical protein
MKSEIQKINTGFAIYETDDKVVKINVRLEEETVWLTQANPADLFQYDNFARLSYRADNEKPMVGMTNFKGNYITKEDAVRFKCYRRFIICWRKGV